MRAERREHAQNVLPDTRHVRARPVRTHGKRYHLARRHMAGGSHNSVDQQGGEVCVERGLAERRRRRPERRRIQRTRLELQQISVGRRVCRIAAYRELLCRQDGGRRPEAIEGQQQEQPGGKQQSPRPPLARGLALRLVWRHCVCVVFKCGK